MDLTGQKIRLAICDDHKIFRAGVVSSLQPYREIDIVCEAEHGKELLQSIRSTRPQVVLLDINMPDLDGLEVCKLIKHDYPKIHVIALSLHEQVYYITGMFKAGAGSYLLKDVDPAEIVKAIHQVMQEGYYLHDHIPVGLVKNLVKMNHPSVELKGDTGDELKEREIEVLRLIANEHTNKEIATQLNLSPVTIENYRNQLLRKTGAKNTAGLVTYAIRKGFVVI